MDSSTNCKKISLLYGSAVLVRLCIYSVAARRPNGAISFEVKLVRLGDKTEFTTENHAHLIVGTTQDDALLADESLIFERFPSPFTLNITTGTSAGSQVRLHCFPIGHQIDLTSSA
jgi:hypothetical protein